MLVIFDCDGVLVDSEIIAAQVDAKALTGAGFEINAAEVAERFAGITAAQIFQIAAEELGREIPDHVIEDASTELDARLAREVKEVAGAAAMLDRLDHARCVCSNSAPDRLQLTLGRSGLWDRFRPYVFSAKTVRDGRPKPAPDVFLHAAEALDYHVDDTIVIEDSVTGVAAAVAAGIRVVGFTGGAHSWQGHAEALMDAGAVTVVASHVQIPQTVDALAAWRAVV